MRPSRAAPIRAIPGSMRLSRPRVVLRAVLLVAGAAFMLAKAWDAWSGADEAGPGGVLLRRIAVVEALVAALALAAAVVALVSLRRRPRTRTLRLDDLAPPPGSHPPGPRP